MDKGLVVVVGATGLQGGSVINTLLELDQYHVQGITRNVHSKPSQALLPKGVKMVEANLDNLDSLKSAFEVRVFCRVFNPSEIC